MEHPTSLSLRVGETIRKVRAYRNMTQKELASVTGIQRSQISRLEKGKCTVTLDALHHIFKALGIPTASMNLGEFGTIALW